MEEAIEKLRSLRKKAMDINASLVDDLRPFFVADKNVFRRLPSGSDTKGNVTNTCSCLMALAISYNGAEFFKITRTSKSNTDPLVKLTSVFQKAVTSEWTSSGLNDDNAFSSLLVLRTAGLLSSILRKPALEISHPTYKLTKTGKLVRRGPKRTLREIARAFGSGAPGSFAVDDYPPTAGIAYWFVDAVEHLSPGIPEGVWQKITTWTSENFARQVALVSSGHDAMKDPVAMMLASCLATRLRRIISGSNFKKRDGMVQELPTNIEVEQAVINAFGFQEKSGIWPKYFPLFNYKKGGAGSNYLFSFEVLEAIVHEFEDSNLLEREIVLDGLKRALEWCESNRLTYRLKGTTYEGWNSGGQITTLMQGKPEAWATATVHMFLLKLQSALSLLIKKRVLRKYRVTIIPQKDARPWKRIIDSDLKMRDETRKTTLKRLIQREILSHIETLGNDVLGRKKISGRRSALLFGPPGTSKTSLVRSIAKRIGWPLVELNPSDFLKEGLENIYSQANEIFNDLKDLWQTVILFDEMDALAQKRAEGIDVTRQFLTTSMLPKLSMLHDEARVLFFMATNHQRQFDDAIKRPGRFDLLICMAPPSWSEKVKFESLRQFLPGSETNADVEFVRKTLMRWVPPTGKPTLPLDLFTFGEFKSFLESLRKGRPSKDAIKAIDKVTFEKKVREWGDNLIALRDWKAADMPKGDLSLRGEFDDDKEVSVKQ